MISLRDVHKSFGDKQVLRGVSLDVAQGQSLAVIGGSGSGKSVIVKLILGLLAPDSGSITIDGENVNTKRRDIMGRIGMLFQHGALFDSLPIWHNVAFRPMQQARLSTAQARAIAVENLERVGLGSELLDAYPAALSGGMHKRVGLARAIAGNPDIVIFDEPTTGLDPIMTDVINQLIHDCVRALGATALTITHDMSSVHSFADKVALLYDGQIIWNGAQDALATSDNPYLAQFINGSPTGPMELVE